MTTIVRGHRSRPNVAGPDSPLPRTGVVLIGPAAACRAMAAMLGSLEGGSPVIAGWIDTGWIDAGWVNTAHDHAQGPASGLQRLGGLNDLPLLIPRLGLRCALACVRAHDRPRVEAALAGTGEGMELRFVPPIEELLAASSPASAGAPTTYQGAPAIDLGLLIGRTPHALDHGAVSRVLASKRVLITGAGGSIGAELARVAASFGPERLILMERSENALFEIDRQMARRHPAMGRRAVLHDVTDADGTLRLLADLRPHVVFHAAAHKHVPLMEDHPGHAVTNNLFGTRSIADAAVACGAERFVMISSDKAVNPTSVMGATKRLAELYVRGLAGRAGGAEGAGGGTRLSMVRFGNVLGSACSVLTIWSSQIAEGGPVTITDPRMTRFFMTIPEAATLVVQSLVVRPEAEDRAGPSSVGVYVLDMGEPISVVELASRFIRAHGLHPRLPDQPVPPGPSIGVVYTGARPGEKLHEELAYAAESLGSTSHPGVRVWTGAGFGEHKAARTGDMVAELGAVRFSQSPGEILAAIRRHVPEMRPGG